MEQRLVGGLPIITVEGPLIDQRAVIGVDPEMHRSRGAQADLLDRLTATSPCFVACASALVRHLRKQGCVIVRGIVDPSMQLVLFGLSTALGLVVDPYGTGWSRIVYRLRRPDSADDQSLNVHLHTDGTDWPYPNDYTCLLCVRPDSGGGGASRVLSREAFVERVASTTGPATVDDLKSVRIPWRIAPELGGGTAWRPVLGPDRVRWLLYTVEQQALELCGSQHRNLLDVLRDVEHAVDTAETFDFTLEPGEALFVDNRRWLHARRPIHAGDSRVVLRTKVQQITRRSQR
jgi:hypothetical protein